MNVTNDDNEKYAVFSLVPDNNVSPADLLCSEMSDKLAEAYDEIFTYRSKAASIKEEVRAEFASTIETYQEKIADLELEVREARLQSNASKLEKLEAHNKALLQSTSWRITAPLRALARIFGR